MACASTATRTTLFVEHHDESFAMLHGIGHALAQAAVVLVVHLELVYYDLDVVILVAIETHAV